MRAPSAMLHENIWKFSALLYESALYVIGDSTSQRRSHDKKMRSVRAEKASTKRRLLGNAGFSSFAFLGMIL